MEQDGREWPPAAGVAIVIFGQRIVHRVAGFSGFRAWNRKDRIVEALTSISKSTNYKTTIAGAVSAGAYAWANAGSLDSRHLLVCVGMAVFAFLSKDA